MIRSLIAGAHHHIEDHKWMSTSSVFDQPTFSAVPTRRPYTTCMQASLDASMALVKRRLLHILFWVVFAAAAAAIAFYLRGRG